MKEILQDIKNKIKNGLYKNEEHVRISIVARILQALNWDIWNPSEVNTEFKVLPNEDSTRVDFALFLNSYSPPSFFIETKSVGKISTDLAKTEQQLRDYNRNNTAEFTIITDGQQWRFYYSQTGGEFKEKCFKILNLETDELEDLIISFNTFLLKNQIFNGNAKKEADNYLQLNKKQRAMEDALPKARRQILESPFPSLPEALIKQLNQMGINVTQQEALTFINTYSEKKIPIETINPELPHKIAATKIKKEKDFPPSGTKCKFRYQGILYEGIINNNFLIISTKGNYPSFSAASVDITKTSRNGWRDWEIQLPFTNKWILADLWRSKK
ncbi:MAG: type I restriction enzyme HsdR N-terminal domain-containing protein [Ignavibacteriaceae bacterium]